MKQRLLAAVLILALVLSGCGGAEQTPSDGQAEGSLPDASQWAEVSQAEPVPSEAESQSTDEQEEESMTVTIGEKRFSLVLEDSKTAAAFRALMPVTLEMQELNGNEKYHYLDQSLPGASKAVKQVHAGDLMLFGSDCVVLFYQSFSTPYTYTPIGHLADPNGLAEAVGGGDVSVRFEVS